MGSPVAERTCSSGTRRAYCDKEIAQGKHHTQALLCLAGRRAGVLFAMLRDGIFYEPQPSAAAT